MVEVGGGREGEGVRVGTDVAGKGRVAGEATSAVGDEVWQAESEIRARAEPTVKLRCVCRVMKTHPPGRDEAEVTRSQGELLSDSSSTTIDEASTGVNIGNGITKEGTSRPDA